MAFNNKPVDSYNEFTDQLGILEDMMTGAKTQGDSLKIRTATLVVSRNEVGGTRKEDTLSVVLTPELRLGFFVKSIAGLMWAT